MPQDSRNMTSQFNTALTPEEERKFQQFAADWSKQHGRDILRDLGDYDTRGWWKAGAKADERGHGTDRYKKPSHPTFSDESIYHSKATPGGSWGDGGFVVGETNRRYWDRGQLSNYFKAREPGVRLIWNPETEYLK